MKNNQFFSFVLLLASLSLSCSFLTSGGTDSSRDLPTVDFVSPAEPLNVTVQLDETSTISGSVSPEGGAMSLTGGDGAVFTLEVPAGALDAETVITMTAVKSIEGAPLDDGKVAAVQLEPSGLFFNELVTLTIVPAQEIPIEKQIIFGYEGSGQDYHLAVVDSKSREIKIMLMEFSGAGVGSGGDKEWAANLQVQASTASTRLWQKFGEFSQLERQEKLLETSPQDNSKFAEKLKATLDQFEDQVVQKEMVAAELDCKFAEQAVKDLLYLGRMRQLAFSMETPGFNDKLGKLSKIMQECRKGYTVFGESNHVSFSGQICGLDKPFTIEAAFPGGGSAVTTFTPNTVLAGVTSVTGGGGECVQTGQGEYTVTINEDGNGIIQWTTTDILTCPNINQTQSGSFSLPLQLAPELACP